MPISLPLSAAALAGFVLLLARVAGLLVFVPLPGIQSGPAPVRAVMSFALAIALFPLSPAQPDVLPSAGRFAALLTGEAAFGVTAGLAVAFLVEVLLIAAQMAGLQAGYSYASTIDPSTQSDSGVLLVLAQLVGGMLFFALGLDRDVIRIFARSLEVYPPGTYFLTQATVEAVFRLGSVMLSTGFRLAMPVIGLLLLVDLALALLGRVHAQLQLLTLAFPLKMMAGLALLAMTAPLYVPVYRGAAERVFGTLTGVLNGR
jgi:flagellar biosynthesis protein FliR